MTNPIIHDGFSQGSLKWLEIHLGKATASGFDQLMTSAFEPRTGEMPKTYLAKRLAEMLTGEPLPGFSSWDTEQGTLLEEEALPWFDLEYGIPLRRVAFIEADGGRCGCSPDALIGDDAGLEIKCPRADTHVRYLIAGVLPPDYAMQVHGSLYVTGRKRWHFLSYSRHLPKFHLIVERDETIMAKIGACLKAFYANFDAALAKINAL